jgi:hypothetical protein
MYVVVGITHTEDHRGTDTDELDSRRCKPEIAAARSFAKGSRKGTSECGIASSSKAPVTGRTDGRTEMNTIIFRLMRQKSNFWGNCQKFKEKNVFHAKNLNEIFMHNIFTKKL